MQIEKANNFVDGWNKLTGMERELARIELDPYYFCTKYIVTFDEEDTENPWKKYPEFEYLKMVVGKIMTPGDKYWLKSQRMLITITFCAMYLHQFLFAKGFNGFMCSKSGAVDGGSKSGWNSLFGKIRMMYDKLPGFIKEYAIGRAYHSSEVTSFMVAKNPKNDNMIMGTAPTDNAGIGEGFTVALVDD